MSSVAGLRSVLKLYESDKVKERTQGGELLREIFSSRENLNAFQEAGTKDGGGGWVALFQCLFQAVIKEKKAALKSSATAQADRRLADAISLVRWMAERAVHSLSRKPFLALFRHLTTLLVHSSAIFPPAALDYAKALKALLSYRPHLETLDKLMWRNLLGICWSALFGDAVLLEADWNDDGLANGENEDEIEVDEEPPASTAIRAPTSRIKITQANNELLSLIPILLSSSTAPIIPPFPTSDSAVPPPASLGMWCLMKIHRFLTLNPTESSGHLPILKSLNLILGELELNSRNEFISAGLRLIGPLVGLWGTKSKALREQLVIALRSLLPFLTHSSIPLEDRPLVSEALDKLLESLPKESSWRWGVEPLDLSVVRFVSAGTRERGAFEASSMMAGFDFTHEIALTWTTIELYASCIAGLRSPLPEQSSSSSSRQIKKRKVEDSISTIISLLSGGSTNSRTLACQVISMLIANHLDTLDETMTSRLRQALLEVLADESAQAQSWAFVALAMLAEATTSAPRTKLSFPESAKRTEKDDWLKVWSYAARKLAIPATCRAACHTADILLRLRLVDDVQLSKDISSILRQIEVQGPSFPYDSVCAFLSSAVRLARADVRLYSLNLESNVVSWLEKWNVVDGTRGKTRMDAQSPYDVVNLLNAICDIGGARMGPRTNDFLPDCAIVEHVLEEFRRTPIRAFILNGRIPSPLPDKTKQSGAQAKLDGIDSTLHTNPRRICILLSAAADQHLDDWSISDNVSNSPPERARRAIDFVILTLVFQASLRMAGFETDDALLERIAKLLHVLLPPLGSTSLPKPAQYLLWRGVRSLTSHKEQTSALWPILVKPDANSGIRPDLLPHKNAAASVEQDTEEDTLRLAIWNLPHMEAPLRDLIQLSKQLMDANDTTSNPSSALNGTQAITHPSIDDDDFGEIRISDSDAMPLSQEAMDCQRTTNGLMDILTSIRTRGAALAAGNTTAVRDTNLLNTLLSSEGPRCLQIGGAICAAMDNGLLMLNPAAVSLILEFFEEFTSSYGYQRDSSFLSLILRFLTCSTPIWLADAVSGTELPEQAMTLAKHIIARCLSETPPSWRVRLDVIVFLDEYLDYDPDYTLWREIEVEALSNTEGDWGPLASIASALVDKDARVRFRATTSTASLFTLPALTPDRQMNFYLLAMEQQPRQPSYWDSFLTDLLFKVNACAASLGVRHAALYHLYEIPLSGPAFDRHLEAALTATAKRLGLSGITPLFATYSRVIVSSLLDAHQSPLALPPALCGYSDIKSMASAILEQCAALLVSGHQFENLQVLCEETGLALTDNVSAKLYPAAALVICRHIAATRGAGKKHSSKQLSASVTATLKDWPRAKGADKLVDVALGNRANIASQLFALLNHDESGDIICASLSTNFDTTTAGIFTSLTSVTPRIDGNFDITSTSQSIDSILTGLAFLREGDDDFSTVSVAFCALIDLVDAIHSSILSSSRLRLLRCVALVAAVFHQDLKDTRLLEYALDEMIVLLPQADLFEPVFEMLKWLFGIVSDSSEAPPRSREIFLRLGTARGALAPELRREVDQWIKSKLPHWIKATHMRDALDAAYVLWPDSTTVFPGDYLPPAFDSVHELLPIASSTDAMALCRYICSRIPIDDPSEDDLAIARLAFWHLKPKLSSAEWTEDGATSFVTLIGLTEGHIQGPSIDLAENASPATARLAARLKNDPHTLVWILILQSLIQLLQDGDHSARSVGYRILRSLRDGIRDIIDKALLLPPETMLLDVLQPASPTAPPSVEPIDLLNLEDDRLRLNFANPEAWSCEFAGILVRALTDSDPNFAQLLPLANTASLATRTLPLLVQATLSCYDNKNDDVPKERRRHISTYLSTILESPKTADAIIQSILHIILHLRHFQPPYRKDVLGFEHWLDIDLLLVSEAAVRIKAYATALMLLEIAISNAEDPKPDLFQQRIQSIMFAVYSNVEDPDGFYGIKTHNVKSALNRRIDHEGLYLRALGLNGAMLQANASGASALPALQNLHHIGLDKLASLLMKPVLAKESSPNDPVFFELAWRTGDWELPISTAANATSAGSFYAAIRAVHRERDLSIARSAVTTSIKDEMLRLRDLGMERMVEIRASAANLICLQDVHSWSSAATQQAIEENDFGSQAIMRFAGLSPTMEFSLAERLTTTRLSILQAAQIKESQKVIGDLTTPQSDSFKLLQKACHLKLASKARIEGNQQAAINAIAAVQVLEDGEAPSAAALDEFNEVLWMQQEHALAIQQIQEMIDALDKQEKQNVYRLAVLLARKAHWTSLAKQLSPHETAQIFDRATRYATNRSTTTRDDREDIAEVAFQYAQFADQYQASIHTAPDLSRLREWRTRKRGELSQIEDSLKKKKDETTKSLRAERMAELEEDERAIRDLEQEHDLFVRHAVRQYAVCLGHSDRHNDSVTRLVSMWFQFAPARNDTKEELKRVDDLHRYYTGPLDRCPSHKFLFLGPQLAARLYRPASGDMKFYTALHALLLRLSKQHPFHILYSIIPLAYGVSLSNGSRKSEIPEGRGPAAAEILQILSIDRPDSKCAIAAKQMSQFHDAAMMWCNVKPDEKPKTKRLTVPTSQPIAKIARMAIPVATVPPPIDYTMEYENVPTLKQYRPEYVLLGGLHRPKKMTAIDTLGKSHYQLFKGDDEIRQDAVMEQVFEMTNKTLERDRKTKERNLKYRTYLVIPLAGRTGILQFVGGGLSIGDWLRPAHDRYRKDIDVTSETIRTTLKKLQEKDHTDPKIVEAFVGYQERFKPVMRHFFTEKHKNPTAWFTMRLNYSRSVAVTSMVGHILGIGDRHLSNIMIDQVTGEVIHIDFGIVFEDGERLRVPEKVPFRLTSDMVDGLGITGVDGTFRRCSEHTLRVLRSNAELIMTVLEVFKHDPLYAWNGDPDKMQRAQGGARSDLLQNTASVQEKADRVLTRIRHKLRDDLSVEYAVNQLVQQARDPENLAKIFHGWHPWV